MSKIFIDTNLFLNLYETNHDTLNIFKDINELISDLVMTDQVFDEFLRNRDVCLQKVVTQIKNNKVNLGSSSLTRHLNEFNDLGQLKKEFDKKNQEIERKIEDMMQNPKNDPIYSSFLKLFTDPLLKKYTRTPEILKKAHERKLIGNPPGGDKENTIGDEIIWETLVSKINDDLIIITRDSTFLDHITFLRTEFEKKTKKSLTIEKMISKELLKRDKKPSLELINFEKDMDSINLFVSPIWKILSIKDDIATVSNGSIIGKTPIRNYHISYMCSRCGNYGPWDGNRCLTCGTREFPY